MATSREKTTLHEKPAIVETQAQQTAVVHVTVPRAQVREVMGPAIEEVLQAVKEQGAAPAGPVFTHHLKIDPEVFDFEVGVPVDAAIEARGRVRLGTLRATKAARAVHAGPYEELAAAWADFDRWIADNDHQAAPDLWERYLKGPESETDPANFRTELVRPLVN